MMATPPPPQAGEPQLDARAYRRAHTGKLMIIRRDEGRKLAREDFFQFDDAGTHPVGLMVTGIFADKSRGHLLASKVRDANEAEIADHQALNASLS
jgi:hypothetical protein